DSQTQVNQFLPLAQGNSVLCQMRTIRMLSRGGLSKSGRIELRRRQEARRRSQKKKKVGKWHRTTGRCITRVRVESSNYVVHPPSSLTPRRPQGHDAGRGARMPLSTDLADAPYGSALSPRTQ